jgi:hypothetical protein
VIENHTEDNKFLVESDCGNMRKVVDDVPLNGMAMSKLDQERKFHRLVSSSAGQRCSKMTLVLFLVACGATRAICMQALRPQQELGAIAAHAPEIGSVQGAAFMAHGPLIRDRMKSSCSYSFRKVGKGYILGPSSPQNQRHLIARSVQAREETSETTEVVKPAKTFR